MKLLYIAGETVYGRTTVKSLVVFTKLNIHVSRESNRARVLFPKEIKHIHTDSYPSVQSRFPW